ncbi:type VI secretion system baseplate subunit TssG [Aggregatibacter actinomycetemcomitans]|uniref:type VI secretion system baseplate subunit TssG n=1 Tax=Aggregatibacter actinomycetemcomitans TaxID=714 RepID=UPI00197C4462|nr:type VI secretion system baseplate subunit TssG [Aggregatibacter actinomycetemcomitans]MBN6065344.1 type VI secretion system baseplate subunit TssG [Aggregatibacter actinomycetemcomitans]MBN6073734.1 type VI secretion system baseplate subunit TssG [Aggregatibacter actinomycetemcomitans]MBN6078177.1 type VI secretion system baseplate subunit TssG [Aggregatibacter actinomycetemcomitans]
MANSDGSARSDVNKDTNLIDITRYSFYQLVELLFKLSNVESSKTLALLPDKEPIRFMSSAGLEFPIRDIVDLLSTREGAYSLEVSFLGLHGSQSPLPTYYLESLATEYLHKETKLVDFMNLFNHRLVLLLHHIWRKYRYYINFRNEGTDVFSQRMFSLVGLGHEKTRNRLSIHHSKMLAYAGMLANPGRSSEVISSLVSHCFDLSDVDLKEWCFRYVKISEEEQNRLGGILKEIGRPPTGRSCLGVNFTLGERNPDRGGKFELQLNNLSRKQFLSFLPNGENYLSLVTFVSFVLKDQFAWDLRLGLKPKQITGMQLGDEKNTMLGWTSFVGKPDKKPKVTISIRE